jgi:Uma2 family endonuclease
MSTVLAPTDTVKTMADLLQKLGDIAPERILVQPPPGTATEHNVLVALEAPHKRICELIDGVLVEKAMGYRESMLAIYLARVLDIFIELHDLGVLTGEAGLIRLWPGRVRIPDLAFVGWHQFPDRKIPEDQIPSLVPDLAIEILSPSNTPGEMLLKREDYFKIGTQLVWEINPRSRTVAVFTTAKTPDAILHEMDSLDGSSVLPGFTLALRDLFARIK